MNVDTGVGVTSVLSKSLRTVSLRVLLLLRIVQRAIEICRMCTGGVVGLFVGQLTAEIRDQGTGSILGSFQLCLCFYMCAVSAKAWRGRVGREAAASRDLITY
jgi:hypothetical protein